MRKKTHILLALFVVSSLALANCAPKDEEPTGEEPGVEETTIADEPEKEAISEEPVELTWLGWSLNNIPNPEETYYKPFQEEYPNVSIVIENYPWGEHGTKSMTLAQSGDLRDVLQVANIRGQPLDALGALEDLTPYIEAEDQAWKDFILPGGFVETDDGRIIGVRWAVTPYTFVYNKRILREAGLEPPTNFDEFKEVLVALRDEDAGTYGAALSYSKENANRFTWLYLAFYMTQKGSYMLDEAGMPAFNNDIGVEAVEYFFSLAEEDLLVPGAEAITGGTTRDMFCSEQVAMIIDGTFMKGICAGRNPDLEMGIVHLQDVTGGHTTGGAFWSMSAFSKNKDEAWEFIKFLSSPNAGKEYFLFSGQVPMYDLFDDPEVKEDEISSIAGEILKDPDIRIMPILPENPELERILVEQIQLAFFEGKDIQQALDDAAAGWAEILEQYK